MTEVKSPKQRMFRMSSIDDNSVCSTNFKYSTDEPMPDVPEGGARVRVCFAGACSRDVEKNMNMVRNRGIMDTSLFPGYEISGIIDELCPSVKTNVFQVGDRVIVFPEEDLGFDDGFSEYVSIKNINNIVKIPNNLSLEVAAMLPNGGLTAYTAVRRAEPYIQRIKKEKGKCDILVIGAGGLGLWTVILAKHLCAPEGTCDRTVRVVVADTNTEKLSTAKSHGCYSVIHWPLDAYEQTIAESTRNACKNGVDVVIDFVSSPKTIQRAIACLNQKGAIVVGGNSQYQVQLDLVSLARKEQSILGVKMGSREELVTLIDLVSSEKVSTPQFSTFSIKEAGQVFKDLSNSKIRGRAVLRISETVI